MSEDIYLRKDTFDETMKRIEAMMSASEARHTAIMHQQNAQIEQIRGEVKELRAEIRGEVKELREHVTGLEEVVLLVANQINNRQNKLQNLLGYMIAGAAVVVAAVQVFLAIFK